MFKTRRQNRYEVLRKTGFLKGEAQTLSQIPFKTPYMKPLVDNRRRDFRNAISRRMTRTQYEKGIRERYDKNGWFDSKGNRSVWAMLREYEHAYVEKHPEWESPWEKRQRKRRDYIKTLEKELAHLPRKPPMTEATKRMLEKQQAEAARHFEYIRKMREGG